MNPWWILGGLAVAAFLVWLARWALGESIDCDRIIAEALAPEPITGTAVQDDLELIWNLPAYGEDGFDRLRQAIRDHREDES